MVQIEILPRKGQKTLWEKEKMRSLPAFSPFFLHHVLKRLLSQDHLTLGLCGKYYCVYVFHYPLPKQQILDFQTDRVCRRQFQI